MNNGNFANMMPNGMRPQLQMQQIAVNHYRNQQSPMGWQQAVLPDERARLAIQMYVLSSFTIFTSGPIILAIVPTTRSRPFIHACMRLASDLSFLTFSFL
jgi:hypothetical protein